MGWSGSQVGLRGTACETGRTMRDMGWKMCLSGLPRLDKHPFDQGKPGTVLLASPSSHALPTFCLFSSPFKKKPSKSLLPQSCMGNMERQKKLIVKTMDGTRSFLSDLLVNQTGLFFLGP